jgi:hypothetical protein
LVLSTHLVQRPVKIQTIDLVLSKYSADGRNACSSSFSIIVVEPASKALLALNLTFNWRNCCVSEIQIGAVGLKGPDCEKATAFLEEALGIVGQKTKKPEYHQHGTRVGQ